MNDLLDTLADIAMTPGEKLDEQMTEVFEEKEESEDEQRP